MILIKQDFRKTHDRTGTYDALASWARILVMYGGTGALGTIAHFVVLFTVLRSVGPVVASTMGAIVGCIVNFFLARKYVFASTTSCAYSFPRFVIVAAFGIALNAMIVNAFVGVLPIALNQAVASATVLLLGFALNKSWTFNES